jgi:hypothetical protein
MWLPHQKHERDVTGWPSSLNIIWCILVDIHYGRPRRFIHASFLVQNVCSGLSQRHKLSVEVRG